MFWRRENGFGFVPTKMYTQLICLQTNQLKLKRQTKVLQKEAFLTLYKAMKPLHCTVKLLVANYWKTCLLKLNPPIDSSAIFVETSSF